MISTDEIRDLLTRHQIVPYSAEELGEDTPITLDSLSLVRFQYALEEEHGIVVDPYDADLDHFTSLGGIHVYLRNAELIVRTASGEGGQDAD